MMDLKIELTKLYSLHIASLKLEHAIREHKQSALWQPFSPSRFIYAFFAFNSIYNFDWEKSFQKFTPLVWELTLDPKSNRHRRMYELDQIKSLLDFYYASLDAETPELFSRWLNDTLELFNISDAGNHLKRIKKVTNENSNTTGHREKFKANFEKIRQPQIGIKNHQQALTSVLSFVYAVRCNIFHGTKTRIEMEDPEQQTRLLIYTAVLIATNSLLFSTAATKEIGWRVPLVHFGKSSDSRAQR